MLIAKLTVHYDRGIDHNSEKDLGLDKAPQKMTEDGKIIRGLGTHFRDQQHMELAKACSKEDGRIRTAFRNRFLVTSIDGLFIVPAPGAAKSFLETLDIRPDVQARVSEFKLELLGRQDEDDAELAEWSKRVKRQLQTVSLGRGKEADEGGLAALETLAGCPALSKGTGNRIRELVAMVRDQKIDRVELRRKMDTLDIEMEMGTIQPRRAPALVK